MKNYEILKVYIMIIIEYIKLLIFFIESSLCDRSSN